MLLLGHGFFLMNYVKLGEALTISIIFENAVEIEIPHIGTPKCVP
jgi:hypothetical protein